MAVIVSQARADPTASREYQVKAAFLYNFIQFVDWPKQKTADGNEPIIIGIIGKDPFGDAFEPIKDKMVKGKKVVIERFKGLEELKEEGDKGFQQHPQIEAIRKCHVLFICSSEKKWLREIVGTTENEGILTVGDVEGFLETGGIVNFIMEDKKVNFEINIITAEKSKLKVSSKLLRLAKKVIREGNDGKNEVQ
jgi:hypothetical protein